MADKIRVLIVDDSPLAREALKAILNCDPLIEVVGEACDGREGVKKAFELRPDVITMDLKMPMMTGLEAIEEIMVEIPTPIIVVSTVDTAVIMKALSIGAMDFVAISQDMDVISKELVEKVKIASKVKPIRHMKIRPFKERLPTAKKTVSKAVVIGASTGGPQALQVLFAGLPADLKAGVLVVQHISAGFIGGLVEWLKYNSHLDVKLAKTGDVLTAGAVLFAPDSYNMLIKENDSIVLTEDISKHQLHVPGITETMKSVAENYGRNAIGVIMTGMGQDGVEGMKAIRDAGGVTIAQDESTSVVFGMNKVAIEKGYVDKVVPLVKIADVLADII